MLFVLSRLYIVLDGVGYSVGKMWENGLFKY